MWCFFMLQLNNNIASSSPVYFNCCTRTSHVHAPGNMISAFNYRHLIILFAGDPVLYASLFSNFKPSKIHICGDLHDYTTVWGSILRGVWTSLNPICQSIQLFLIGYAMSDMVSYQLILLVLRESCMCAKEQNKLMFMFSILCHKDLHFVTLLKCFRMKKILK